jgi:hypothetical protein
MSHSEQDVSAKDGYDRLALVVGDRAQRDGGKPVADPDGSARGLEGEPGWVVAAPSEIGANWLNWQRPLSL